MVNFKTTNLKTLPEFNPWSQKTVRGQFFNSGHGSKS